MGVRGHFAPRARKTTVGSLLKAKTKTDVARLVVVNNPG
jgi:hypothetical protein